MVVRGRGGGRVSKKHWQAEAVATEAWNNNAEEFVCCCLSQIIASALPCKGSDSLLLFFLFFSEKSSNCFHRLLKIKPNHY